MPVVTQTVVAAAEYGADEQLAAQGAAISTLACFVVTPVLMLLLYGRREKGCRKPEASGFRHPCVLLYRVSRNTPRQTAATPRSFCAVTRSCSSAAERASDHT